jgi:tetratricopeptide (TPR) repeat protein
MIQFLLLLAGEQARGSWQCEPPVTNAWLSSLIPPLDNCPNPPGGIAEHPGNLIWRVALLDQPQDVPVRSLDGMGCASIAGVQLFRCQVGLDGHSFRHACIIQQLYGFDMIGPTEMPPEWRAMALYSLGDVLLSLDKLERAETLAAEALEHARQYTDASAMSMVAFSILGMIARRQVRLAEAASYFTESEAHARLAEAVTSLRTSESPTWQALDEAIRGTALLNHAELAELQGDLALATTLTEEGRAMAQEEGVPFVVAGMTTRLGHLARLQGDNAQARAHYREALALFRAFGSPTLTAWCLEGLAATLGAEGCYVQSTRLCAAADALREQAQTPLPPAEQMSFQQTVARAQGILDEATFGKAWAVGAAFTQEEAIDDALRGSGTESETGSK